MAVLAKDIRNIALIGHSGEGKTSLAEAILYNAGALDRFGKVDDGNSTMDFDAEEIARKISISLSVANCTYKGVKINVIDVPGYFDFECEMLEALSVADSAIIVTGATGSMSVGTEKALEYCSEHKIPANFALLAPIARGLHHGQVKHWAHFNELCLPLREMGIEPIVFPSPHEEEENRNACPNATILPPTTLGNYAALAKLARIVIANDSGISHVAAAVGAKQLTLVGVTDVDRTRPWNPSAMVLGDAEKGWPSTYEVISAMKSIIGV